ncbi:ABC transporter ATP-binding protein [Desulforhopalus singaporensis]|uniref:Amino acid/amide ABC transporter ATP-binding protein 2, HAAT family n=1 Tax=Desulforhopalus singaporensis TaxID=91360 RepID=A0A1H0N9F7_9BACT|nr:ABC transporter ATP-binding protein [Desulforhopalus singaporensis]SDO89055.1 amino acid/amide ABC transporter ATP-binding protein 2, HAAT family [Desulforhopalus singaporensis]
MLLKVKNLNAGYGFLNVLWDVSLNIGKGEFVALIGPNGAGKSTVMKSISGLLPPKSGTITFDGQVINNQDCAVNCRSGLSYISEELNLFTGMTILENLEMGAQMLEDKNKARENLDFVFELFPRLEERISQYAGTLSGGERKMLAIARGLMSNPTMVLVDEPSLGLAPQVTDEVFNALRLLNRQGLTILLVEQNVTKTLKFSSRAYILEKGKVVLEGPSSELITNDHVRKIYLGT